jgi:tRNA threonylcarbamoyladenosine biosynthesis protein TsaE
MSMKKRYLTTSPSQTENLGKKIAKEILKSSLKKKAVVIGLVGDLGGGKTTFVRGLAKGLRINQRVLSPTFILLRKFQIPKSKYQINSKFQTPKFQSFYHIDCYRIEKPKEILDLGFKEIISDPKNIICIEWADRIKKILPKNAIILKFKFEGKNKRKILINSPT